MKLQIVGGGKMGEALLGGVIRSGWADPGELAVIELAEARRRELASAHPGVVVGDALHPGVDALIAVKPQHVSAVITELATLGVERILSVAAGVTIGSMNNVGPDMRVIRCMPNTPALVGAGASAIAGGPNVTDDDLEWAESILSAVGIVERVEEADICLLYTSDAADE